MQNSEKSVPSGTFAISSGPVHEHGLRATAARSAFKAKESTHPTLPTKRNPKKLGGERKMGVNEPDRTHAENFALIPPPLEGPDRLSEQPKRPEHESIQSSAHANIYISSELSSTS